MSNHKPADQVVALRRPPQAPQGTFVLPTLDEYQQVALDFLLGHPYRALFLGMGLGKTLITLYYLAMTRPPGHILVIAPSTIAKSTWQAEIDKWGFPIRTQSLMVKPSGAKLPRKDRLALYDQMPTAEPTMYFLGQNLVPDLVSEMAKRGTWPLQTVIIDESQGFKNPTSQRFLDLSQARPYIHRLVELTGTPRPQSIEDLWSQMYLLDMGATLGPSIEWFRATFMEPDQWRDNRVISWRPLPGAEDEVNRRIASLAMSAENTSIQLPELTQFQMPVFLSDADMAAYKRFKKEQVLELVDDTGNGYEITAANAAVLKMRLLQYASGTIYLDDKHSFGIVHEGKVDMLDHLIRGADGPVLVAYRFVSERKLIADRLSARGHRVHVFNKTQRMIQRWNAGELDVMLIHPASAGHGLNLQEGPGHTMVWYTLPWSLEHYQQANARLHRRGQANPVTIVELVVAGTEDAATPALLQSKDDGQAGTMQALRRDPVQELAEDPEITEILGSPLHVISDQNWDKVAASLETSEDELDEDELV